MHSLLSFARQDAPERKVVDLHTVMEEVLEIMAYDLRTSNVTIVKEFAPSLPAIMADPHQLQQVFVNILGNARQAIEPFQREGRIVDPHAQRGALRDPAAQRGELGHHRVPGQRPRHQAAAPDAHLRPVLHHQAGGQGHGPRPEPVLRPHPGARRRDQRAERTRPRRDVPHRAAHGQHARRRSATRSRTPFPFPQTGGPSGKTILVVDDEEWILDLASELLRSEGHEVETAASGQQAIELLGRQKFDVLVSDWKMPGLNGIRLYEHLLATHPDAAKRMLFMTGDVVSDVFQEFLEEHHLACLSKPFAISEFRAAVTRMFRKMPKDGAGAGAPPDGPVTGVPSAGAAPRRARTRQRSCGPWTRGPRR